MVHFYEKHFRPNAKTDPHHNINWLVPLISACMIVVVLYTQRRVQPDQSYFTVEITVINFESSLLCNSTVIVCIALLLHII